MLAYKNLRAPRPKKAPNQNKKRGYDKIQDLCQVTYSGPTFVSNLMS